MKNASWLRLWATSQAEISMFILNSAEAMARRTVSYPHTVRECVWLHRPPRNCTFMDHSFLPGAITSKLLLQFATPSTRYPLHIGLSVCRSAFFHIFEENEVNLDWTAIPRQADFWLSMWARGLNPQFTQEFASRISITTFGQYLYLDFSNLHYK